ncbi:MAG: hypothetical protein HRT47_12530 [Candidatus Caenarcaniphilales bacterium]|nr:hypothetical protein [Candidatus Caenarcaniphilales bacterium]
MPELKVKQHKKEIFLDLSSFDFSNDSFRKELESELSRSAGFFSGNSVSVIIPEMELNKNSKDVKQQIQEIQDSLNKQNISLRASYAAGDLENMIASADSFRDVKLSYDDGQTETVSTSKEEVKDEEYNIPDTLYVKSNLRAGHLIRYPGSVVIIGDINPSAEIIAQGDVLIWGTCRGIVHAGSSGNEAATIRALKFSNCQLRIAEKFLGVAKEVEPKKNEKNNYFNAGELAKIENSEIMIYKS